MFTNRVYHPQRRKELVNQSVKVYRETKEELRVKDNLKNVFLSRPLKSVKFKNIIKTESSLRDIDMHDIGVGGSFPT